VDRLIHPQLRLSGIQGSREACVAKLSGRCLAAWVWPHTMNVRYTVGDHNRALP